MRNWRFWQVVYEDVTKPFITPEQSIGQPEQGPLFVTIDSDGKQIPNEELDRLKVKLSEKEHELAISIIGGRRQQYHLDQYYRLVKVIDSTDAVFIVTSSSSRLEQAITRIFARTRALQQNNGSGNNGPDRFRTESRENVFDSNISNHPALDNETTMDENEFRSKLEHLLIVEKKVPLMTVLMSGANDEKERVMQVDRLCECVEDNKPVIVIKGSGIIAKLIEKLKSRMDEFDRIAGREIRNYICRRGDDEIVNSLTDKLRSICKSDKVELMDSNDSTAIHNMILEQLRSKLSNERTFDLAVQWDNIDFAAEIFEYSDIQQQNDKMQQLIIDDKIEFVKLWIDSGVDMKEILTRKVLETMYHKTETLVGSQFKQLTTKRRAKDDDGSFKLKDVNKVLTDLTYYGDKYSDSDKEDEKFNDPFHELMIYSIFFCRLEMANYFWEQTERLLLNALIAVFMAHKFKKHFFKRFDETKVESYLRIERTFENHAIELINRAQQHDPCRTSELMESESDPYWPKLSLIEIAAAGNAKEFLGTEACQSEIFRRWNRGYECNRKKYLAAFMFPPLIFFDFFVRFDEENAAAKWHSKDPTVYRKMDRCPQLQSSLQSNNQCSTWISLERCPQERFGCVKKLTTFYTSACSKFTFHSIFYILYLLLFSYVVLFQYQRDAVSSWEWFLYGCQLSFYIELIITRCSWSSVQSKSRLISWPTSGTFATWHNLDFCHMIIMTFSWFFRLHSSKFSFLCGHLLLLSALTISYLRVFKIIFIMPYFGPKVIAIARMSQALWMFFTFFLVFMVAYSICSIALIDLNLVPSLRTIRSLFFHGLWDIFGELGEEQSTGAIVGCPDNITEAGLFSTVDAFDCSIRQLTVQLLLALYLFIASVLLMNALIAVLTHIFDEINEGSTRVWRYQMYFLVKEYDCKFILRAPLVILYLLYLTLWEIWKKIPDCLRNAVGGKLRYLFALARDTIGTFFSKLCKKCTKMLDWMKTALSNGYDCVTTLISRLFYVTVEVISKLSPEQRRLDEKCLEACKDLEAICQAQYLETIHSSTHMIIRMHPDNGNLVLDLPKEDIVRVFNTEKTRQRPE